MVQITKQEKEWLIEKKFLKCVKGQYPDLAVTSRFKKGKRKRFFVNENLARFLPKVEVKK